MRHCLTLKSLASSSTTAVSSPTNLPGEGNSTQDTPTTSGTSAAPSSTVNLSREYALAVQTSSYNEIWSKIHVVEQWHSSGPAPEQQLLLAQVLQPDRESVQSVLEQATPSTFTQLVTSYFEHSEKTCNLLLLHNGIHLTRSSYAHLHTLIDVLPDDIEYVTDLQCNHAFDTFSESKGIRCHAPIPITSTTCAFVCLSSSNNLTIVMCGKVRQIRCGTTALAVCLIGTVVGVTLSAIAIGTHALIALVATFSCPVFHPSKISKKEVSNMAHLDAAAKSAYVLHNDLDTIDRLVSRLHTEIEGDMLLIQLGLDRGRDKYPIYEVVKQLRKNRKFFNDQLTDLEEHMSLLRCN